MKLSKHFDLKEFYVSSSFPHLVPEIPRDADDVDKLLILVNSVLEPVRNRFGVVTILSGKRSLALNTAVGGQPNSEHLYDGPSCAVDFACATPELTQQAFDWLVVERHGCYGQLIHYTKSKFIHVSLPTVKHINHNWEWEK